MAPNLNIKEIAVSGNNILALTDKEGLFIANNTGKTWKPVDIEGDKSLLKGLTAFKSILFIGTEKGLFKSENNGLTWKQVPGFESKKIYLVTNSTDFIVTATEGNGRFEIFYSSPDGINWTLVKNPVYAEAKDVIASGSFIYEEICKYVNGGTVQTKTNSGCWLNELKILKKNGKEWENYPFRLDIFG